MARANDNAPTTWRGATRIFGVGSPSTVSSIEFSARPQVLLPAGSRLNVTEFDIQNEVDLRNVTVEGRLLVDNNRRPSSSC